MPGDGVISELEKYRLCYENENYHLQGARLVRVKRDIQELEPGIRYLDVGCGRGEMVKLARQRGVDAFGLDLVPELCDGTTVICGEMTALPFENDSYQFVSCYDAIEHLPTDQVDAALDELWRVCWDTLLITTNNKASTFQGMDLHLTRKPRAWWCEQFEIRGGVQTRSDYGNGEWHWKITLR